MPGASSFLGMDQSVRKEELTIRISIALIMASAGLWLALPAAAQSEIDPDHFESPNAEPFEKAKINTSTEARALHYDGKFTLPYTVQCSGKSLSPGRYFVSLHSNGKIGQATLKQRGRAIGVPGVVHKPAHKNGSDTLVVVELEGRTRRLSAIQVAELDLIFEPGLAMEAASNRRPRRFEKLPLVPVN
jgi:hypothetical protein